MSDIQLQMTNKVCPRCGTPFVCHHENPSICQCAGIPLSDNARAFLRTHYPDCLCRNCLLELNAK